MNKKRLNEQLVAVRPVASRRSFFRFLAAATAFALGRANASADPSEGALRQDASNERPLKIVLHVGDADEWPYAVSNLRNLTSQYPTAIVRVIVDGSAVYLFSGANDVVPVLSRFAAKGVQMQVCHNALGDKQIDPKSVPSFVQVIPAAVVALAQAQYDGFAYIRP
jgi:intracellular sulfur oxidation DsrE/DsrF family protein